MKIFDWYILKRYIITFLMLILLFIPIGIIIDLSEKIDNMFDNEAPTEEIVEYYFYFTIYFANLLFPILLFLSIIWFTSKLANNTEIVAFLSSGVSFYRFLRPYLFGATIVCLIAISFSMYLVPKANIGFFEFKYQYLEDDKATNNTRDSYRQINDNEVIYATNFKPKDSTARNFTLEHFEGNRLKFKIKADNLEVLKDSIYRLSNYKKRIILAEEDSLIRRTSKDTLLPFEFGELTPKVYEAETLNYFELVEFIEEQRRRGSPNLNRYTIALHKRWSTPISAFVLTFIAVAVSSIKRRGGIGINLMIGIAIAFSYVFIDKVFASVAEKSNFSPIIAVWTSNVIFAIVAILLVNKAKR